MKRFATLVLTIISLSVSAQKSIIPTNEFPVTGWVKKEMTVTRKDIEKLPAKDIPDVIITNHKGESHGSLKQLKGVLLKDVLKDMELKEDNPKLFSEFYFTFTASDNYKVVYSWNELFNSLTGDNIFIVTSIDSESLQQMHNRILIITPTDYKTGRRYIKCLSKITVSRVE